jgi:hypothetical protein
VLHDARPKNVLPGIKRNVKNKHIDPPGNTIVRGIFFEI